MAQHIARMAASVNENGSEIMEVLRKLIDVVHNIVSRRSVLNASSLKVCGVLPSSDVLRLESWFLIVVVNKRDGMKNAIFSMYFARYLSNKKKNISRDRLKRFSQNGRAGIVFTFLDVKKFKI